MFEEEIKLAKKHTASPLIRQFRSSPKKAYKLALCGMFADLLDRGKFSDGFFYGEVFTMSTNLELNIKLDDNANTLISRLENDLERYYFHSLDNDSINEVIAFFRKIIKDIEDKNKRLYLVSEVQKVYDIKKMYKESQNISLKDHHWLDINFSGNPITPTYPDFFNYIDLINLWNDYIYKYKEREHLLELGKESNDAGVRRLSYGIDSSLRFLTISAIALVESYLYYFFYNVKNSTKYNDDNRVQGIINRPGYIQDTQVIEDVIFILYDDIKEDFTIQEKYRHYKEALKLRDRFVHTSAFVDESNQLSQLQPLINIDRERIIFIIQNSVDLVVRIDELLSTKDKILVWWDRFATPDFNKLDFINTLNIMRN